MGQWEAVEKDTNAAIKNILCEVEIAARTEPGEACQPYVQEKRRQVVIRTIWGLVKRSVQEGIEQGKREAEVPSGNAEPAQRA